MGSGGSGAAVTGEREQHPSELVLHSRQGLFFLG